MRYVAKILDNVRNVNDFNEVGEIHLTRGNSTDLYFRLFTERSNGDNEELQRYIPQGTSIQVDIRFDNLDQEYDIRRTAIAPFAGDNSIWSIPILAQDQLMFNGMRVTLTEDNKKTTFIVETDIAAEETGDRRRFT